MRLKGTIIILAAAIPANLCFSRDSHAIGCGETATVTTHLDYRPGVDPPIPGSLRYLIEAGPGVPAAASVEYCSKNSLLPAPTIYIPGSLPTISLREPLVLSFAGQAVSGKVAIVGDSDASGTLTPITTRNPTLALVFVDVNVDLRRVHIFDTGGALDFTDGFASVRDSLFTAHEETGADTVINYRSTESGLNPAHGRLTITSSRFEDNAVYDSVVNARSLHGAPLQVKLDRVSAIANTGYGHFGEDPGQGPLYLPGGGVLHVWAAELVTIENSTFHGNLAPFSSAGAVELSNVSEAVIRGNGFSENGGYRPVTWAGGSWGGALGIEGNIAVANIGPQDIVVTGNRFLDNSSGDTGLNQSVGSWEAINYYPDTITMTLRNNVIDEHSVDDPGFAVTTSVGNSVVVTAPGFDYGITLKAIGGPAALRMLQLTPFPGNPGVDHGSNLVNVAQAGGFLAKDAENQNRGFTFADAGPDDSGLDEGS